MRHDEAEVSPSIPDHAWTGFPRSFPGWGKNVTFHESTQLLRAIGVGICVVEIYWLLSLPSNANDWDPLQWILNPKRSPLLSVALRACVFSCFAGAFWAQMNPDTFFVASRKKLILIGIQTLLALSLNAYELLYLVSAETGLLLPNRRGLAWISSLTLIDIAMGLSSPETRDWMYPTTVMRSLPEAVGIITVTAASHLLSFSFGSLAAVERRQRHELELMQEIQERGARLAERSAIARELHDSFGHSLTGLIVKLQLAMNAPEQQRESHIHEAYLLSRVLLNDVRSTVTDFREIDGVELRSALTYMANRVISPKVKIEFEEGLHVEERTISHALFRCAQEFITNAVRHADARSLILRLTNTATDYELHAQDDGRGATTVRAGNGLLGIRERVEELGGSMEIVTAPGMGFLVSVKVPRLGQESL